MKTESRELYVYTKDHYIADLKRISPECVAPMIATRQVVKRAINQYIIDYCSKGDDPFSHDDFTEVSNKIYDEIIAKTL